MSAPLTAEHDLVVVGAGAAGLWAAARAAELGRDVLLLEKTPRAGTKVLASGGSRCNLTTTHDPRTAARLFGQAGERFLRSAFAALTPEDVRERFAELGVSTVEAPLDKVFPASQSARDVRDALLRAVLSAGATLRTDAEVERVGRLKSGGWELRLRSGAALTCRTLFLAPGGKSYPGAGTTGDGYRWLEELELEVVPPVPALAPLTSEAGWVHELTGLALQGASVRLLDAEGRNVAARTRPLLFTHFGVSGPAAMDVSGVVARAHELAGRRGEAAPSFELAVDLVPGLDREELRRALIERGSAAGRPRLGKVLSELASEPLPRRLADAITMAAGLGPSPVLADLDKRSRHQLVETLKGLRIPISGTRGWEFAEVTRGGLELRALDPRTMRVNGREELFVFGELLDLDGPIGGLNFQAAFSTAELAARSAAGDR